MKTAPKVNNYPKLDIAKIRRIRKESGRTLTECARAAGLPPEIWELIESGRVRKIEVTIVVLIWRGLACDGKEIMTEVRGKFTRMPKHVFIIDSDVSDAVLPMPLRQPPNRPSKRRRPVVGKRSALRSRNTQPSLN